MIRSRAKARWILLLLLISLSPSSLLFAQGKAGWRAATSRELEAALPLRAPVGKEHIETEMRTASGIINHQGQVIAGVVLITAGYSADGKYSHYLVLGEALNISGVSLPMGRYVFGWKRGDNGLEVTFYDALSGMERGSAVARPMPAGTRVESFHLWPPAERGVLQIGRFQLPYTFPAP